jgi:protein-S-isoprenylcysteine O-methyltransferase Ste14
MPPFAYVILAVGTLLWLAPFLVTKRNIVSAQELDRRARWGILLVAVAYSILWQTHFWERSPEGWRIVASVFFFLAAVLLSWTSVRALGRQWRIDAGLNPDHELVTSGPYRVVRHPIYTSMLCVLSGTGFLIAPLPILLLSTLVFIAGAEIRMRIEDKLLASRFGERFEDYRRRVPAYIPFVR